MVNLAREIEKQADRYEELIEAVVVGYFDGWKHSYADVAHGDPTKVLTWNEARPLLDYDYDNGYGGADCHPVYAWTATRLILVHEYDGATHVYSVPRHPTPETPNFC